MINEVLFLQSFGFSGNFGSFLSQLEQIGAFSYVLPFLLIFALVFGILQKVNIFNNKGVDGIIALSVGLMSLQFGFVSRFFAGIFPNLGLGLAVILAALILLGLFTDSNQTGLLWGLGAIVFIFVIWNSFEFGTSNFGFWFTNNLPTIIFSAIVIALIVAMIFPMNFEEKKNDNPLANAVKALSGGK